MADNPDPAGRTLTPAELDAIRARADAATPGPWIAYYSVQHKGATIQCGPGWLFQSSYKGTMADAELCARARTDIPALLAHIAEQEAVIKQLREALESAGKYLCDTRCHAHESGDERQHHAGCRKLRAALDAAGRKVLPQNSSSGFDGCCGEDEGVHGH